MNRKSLFYRRFRPIALALGLAILGTGYVFAENISFDAVLAIAEKLGALRFETHPLLERPEANESQSIRDIALSMFLVQMHSEPLSRDAHAKGHVCAAAKFEVDADLPDELRVGLFAQTRPLDAILRFSNGSGTTKADAVPDGRGIAIKVLAGAPNGNLLGTGNTQDFLMINSPHFFVRSVADYARFESAIVRDQKPNAFFLARAIREALAEAGRSDAETRSDADIAQVMLAIAKLPSEPQGLGAVLVSLFQGDAGKIGAKLMAKLGEMQKAAAPLELKIAAGLARPIGSSATEPYFSMSSYLLKSATGGIGHDTAVKYIVRPVDCLSDAAIAAQAPPANPSEDYLREDLISKLRAGKLCYRFFLQALPQDKDISQLQTLVEDSRLDYGTTEIPVARIVISKQDAGKSEKLSYCETLSFNPWQAASEHQPLGAMNRARKLAVTASSIRRHLLRAKDRIEPVRIEEFSEL